MRWAQQEDPSSHWTTELSQRRFTLAVIAFTLFHLFMAPWLPITEDELYYWTWSQNIQMSYFDHPMMVALLIRIGTLLFGNTIFAIRFFAIVLSSATVLLLGVLSPRRTLLGLLLFTPLFLIASCLMTPDSPLLFFWTAYLALMVRINTIFSVWQRDPMERVYRSVPVHFYHWIGAGTLLGLGILSKYTMALAIPCSFLLFLTAYRVRAWILGYSLHLLTAFIVALPILLYNLKHNYAPLLFQWNHTLQTHSHGWSCLFEFIGSQILFVGLLPFLMLPIVLMRARQFKDNPTLHTCLWFFGLPFFFFLYRSISGHLEANWPLVAFLAFWPMAQKIFIESSFFVWNRALLWISFALPFLFSLVILVHLLYPIKWIPPEKDRISKMQNQAELLKIAADKVRLFQLPLFSSSYQFTSFFRFYGIHDSHQIHPGTRMSQFTVNPVDVCQYPAILAFQHETENIAQLDCFKHRSTKDVYTLTVRGKKIANFYLHLYEK